LRERFRAKALACLIAYLLAAQALLTATTLGAHAAARIGGLPAAVLCVTGAPLQAATHDDRPSESRLPDCAALCCLVGGVGTPLATTSAAVPRVHTVSNVVMALADVAPHHRLCDGRPGCPRAPPRPASAASL
jgi:tRNA A37 threonylcarbamoyladenosine synthetase subunit TsaC/SUA5/YrdC